MSVSARALYDYSARSDKELTFKRGDTLKVIEKSPDGHWWDGLCGSNRGFIPVAYVEIIELQTTSSNAELTAIPAPPTRRSSMQERKEEMELEHTASEIPGEPAILEVPDHEVTRSPEPPKVTLTVEAETEEISKNEETTLLSPTEQSKQEPSSQKPPITGGSVKALSGKFTQPPPSQQVLVHPYRKHIDLSPRKSYEPPQTTLDTEGISRSASASSSTTGGGGRVTQLTEQLKLRNPPPTKPRPHSHTVSPGADRATASFQITPHSSTVGSPLQQAQLGSQLTNKPSSSSTSGNKTTPSKTPRGAGVLRRDRSQKREDRPPLPSKPIAKPPPPKAPTELRAELQAAVGKRRPTD